MGLLFSTLSQVTALDVPLSSPAALLRHAGVAFAQEGKRPATFSLLVVRCSFEIHIVEEVGLRRAGIGEI